MTLVAVDGLGSRAGRRPRRGPDHDRAGGRRLPARPRPARARDADQVRLQLGDGRVPDRHLDHDHHGSALGSDRVRGRGRQQAREDGPTALQPARRRPGNHGVRRRLAAADVPAGADETRRLQPPDRPCPGDGDRLDRRLRVAGARQQPRRDPAVAPVVERAQLLAHPRDAAGGDRGRRGRVAPGGRRRPGLPEPRRLRQRRFPRLRRPGGRQHRLLVLPGHGRRRVALRDRAQRQRRRPHPLVGGRAGRSSSWCSSSSSAACSAGSRWPGSPPC